jgi:hypothetical protein
VYTTSAFWVFSTRKGKGQQSLWVGCVVKGKDKFQSFRTFWSHIHFECKDDNRKCSLFKKSLNHVNIEYPKEENTCEAFIYLPWQVF